MIRETIELIPRGIESRKRVLGVATVLKAGEIEGKWQEVFSEPLPTPIATCATDEYRAAEFPGGRCVIVWRDGSAEFRIDENQEGAQ